MTVRQQKHLLWLAAAGIALAAIAILFLGWTLPFRQSANLAPAIAPTPQVAPPNARPPLDPREFDTWLARDLRKPLFHESPAAAQTGAPLTLQLVGTAIEAGHSVAMLRKSDGTFAFCRVGESVDDVGGQARVTRIDADRVSLQYAGALRELQAPRTPGAEGIIP